MIELFNILYKWKIPILLVCAFTAILSTILTLRMPNYYQSTAIVMPSSPYITDRNALFSKTAGENPVYMFGGGAELDRIIGIGKSNPLINQIIKKFDLTNHYYIDKTDPLYLFETRKIFDGNFDIIKNELDLIEISFEDIDPQFASNVTNEIVRLIDERLVSMVSNNKTQMANLIKINIKSLNKKIDEISSRIKRESRSLSESDLDLLNEIKSNYIKNLSDAQLTKDQYLTLVDHEISSVYVVQEASPALYKSRPVRSILILSSILLSLLACSLIAVIYEQFKKYNKKNLVE